MFLCGFDWIRIYQDDFLFTGLCTDWLYMEQVGFDDSCSHGSSFVHDLCFRAPRSQMVPQRSRRP